MPCVISYQQLSVAFGLATAVAAAAPAQSPYAGRWAGRWVDVSGTQGGTIEVIVGPTGALSGVVTNGPLRGVWAGDIRPNGAVLVNYQYPGQPVASLARGAWNRTAAGQLAGRMAFFYQGRQIGVGDFGLAPAASSYAAGGPAAGGVYAGGYPYGLASYLYTIPNGASYASQFGLPDINEYRANPSGYIEALVPGFGAAVSGATADVNRLGSAGASPSGAVRNTIGMVNAMMRDASRLTPEQVQRKYGGVNALAGAITAQDRIYSAYFHNRLDRQALEAQSAAAQTEAEAARSEWRAAWSVWESQLERWKCATGAPRACP